MKIKKEGKENLLPNKLGSIPKKVIYLRRYWTMPKFLRVDMAKKEVNFEDVPEKYLALGGRALTSQMVLDEVPATCNPLGEFNKVIIAPGLLSGTNAPSSGRLSVGGKSPLTGGIKEANAGGICSQKIANLDIKAIILEGKPAEKGSWLIKVSPDGAELLVADELANKEPMKLLQFYGNVMAAK
ncbi:hypothetical protein N752_27915 [Desulforamulus aquiferis]|nr:hypothetical protein N752_27915 [Desulforamulus aquiferis]